MLDTGIFVDIVGSIIAIEDEIPFRCDEMLIAVVTMIKVEIGEGDFGT